MGGEEFALLMPGTSSGEAVTVCERMRRSLETHDWSTVEARRPGDRELRCRHERDEPRGLRP